MRRREIKFRREEGGGVGEDRLRGRAECRRSGGRWSPGGATTGSWRWRRATARAATRSSSVSPWAPAVRIGGGGGGLVRVIWLTQELGSDPRLRDGDGSAAPARIRIQRSRTGRLLSCGAHMSVAEVSYSISFASSATVVSTTSQDRKKKSVRKSLPKYFIIKKKYRS